MRMLSLLALFAGLAAGQPARDFFPWWEMPVVRDLNLSDEQMRQIQSIRKEYRDKLVDLRGSVEKAENQLSDLMNEDYPDASRVNAAIERLIAARGELTRAFAQMGFRLRAVLTVQQWRELQRRRPQLPPPVRQPPLPRPPGQPALPPQPGQPRPQDPEGPAPLGEGFDGGDDSFVFGRLHAR